MTLSLLLCLVFPAALSVAAAKDVTSFTIPNWIPGLLVVAFWPAALAAHLPLAVLGADAGLAVVLLLAGMGVFALGWCGGGDAKLFAAAALWLGVPALVSFLWWTCLSGGLIALGLLVACRLAPATPGVPGWLFRLIEARDLPYGVAIAIGALCAFPQSPLGAALIPA